MSDNRISAPRGLLGQVHSTIQWQHCSHRTDQTSAPQVTASARQQTFSRSGAAVAGGAKPEAVSNFSSPPICRSSWQHRGHVRLRQAIPTQ